MRTQVRLLLAAGFLCVAALAVGSPDGPIPSLTGAPGEGLCTDCHGGDPPSDGGGVTILGAPAFYRAGSTYTLTVRLASTLTASSPARVWGFQLTAIDAGGAGAGTFSIVPGQGTTTIQGEGPFSTRQYAEQIASGMRSGIASPVDWNVEWTAPKSGAGPITFHAAGLAGDGDGSESGDWTYSGSFAAQDTTTPARPASWGFVKSVYR